MNETYRDPLLTELADLAEDVPPMPEDIHAGWVQLVKEDASMDRQTTEKRPFHLPRRVVRMLSAAAAVVFVVGGTLLTKDTIAPTNRNTALSGEYAAYKNAPAGDTGGSLYMARTASSYDAPMESAMGDYDAAYEADIVSDDAAAYPQKIIRTASITFSTREFDAACEQVRGLCKELGGWVAYSSEYKNGSGLRNASFTLRVPSDRLDEFLTGADGVGRVTSRSESANDVTDSYYDTATRLESKRVLLDRLLSMATSAADLSDLLALETKIADIQYDIDRLQGNLNRTDNQVNYATVDVTVRQEADTDAMQVKEKTLGERLVSALSVGLEAFAEFVSDMAVFLVAALPFLVGIAVVIVIARVVRRKRRK